MTAEHSTDLLDATVRLASAYLGRNAVPVNQISQLVSGIHGALVDLGRAEPEPEPLKPAVPIKKSITPDYLVCLEDGKHLKMLKRHLRTSYDMTPQEYRAKWGLAADYPMVAPSYAKARSNFAKKIGLGRPVKAIPRKRRSSRKAEPAA